MSINFTAIPTKNGVCRLVLTVIAVVYYNHAGGDETDYREEVVEDSATIIVGIPSIVPSSWYVIMNDNGGVITLSVERDIYNLTIFAPEYIYVEPTSMDYVPAGSNLTIILRPVVEKKTDDAVVIAWRENETLYAIVIDTIYNPSMHAKVDYYSISGRVTGILAIVILLCSIVLGGIGKKLKLLLNGVDATNNLHSNQFYYYTFPASLIKRVEVTKTPNALLNDETLLGNLKDLLEKYPIDPSLIDIEITETLQMEDVETSIKMLQEIKRLGFKVSIDDFGTGYSSLNLKRFPFDVIKRDREFVKDMYKNKEDIILVK